MTEFMKNIFEIRMDIFILPFSLDLGSQVGVSFFEKASSEVERSRNLTSGGVNLD